MTASAAMKLFEEEREKKNKIQIKSMRCDAMMGKKRSIEIQIDEPLAVIFHLN